MKNTNPAVGPKMIGIHKFVRVLVLALALLWISPSVAYDNFNNCNDCHGDFRDDPYISLKNGTNWGTDLMAGHLTFISGCDVCHSGGGFKTVITSFSGNVDKPQGCVGCHGRVGDESNVCTFGNPDADGEHCGSGTGLRKLHEASPSVPANTCYLCHSSEIGAFPVGENEAPFNYGRSGITLTSPCTAENIFGANGLDNDGDGTVDAADTDCSPAASVANDLNGDGNADILWRNGTTGQNWAYLMTGANIDSSVGVNTVPTDWEIVGNGDYNGDGNADVLWRNGTTGQNWMYLMTGANIDSSVSVNSVSDLNWKVVGNGDYNGDGNADILWRNISTGQNWMYLMTGAVIDSSVGVNTVPTVWQVASSGDYNNDGNADIVWRNSSTGQNWLYLMTGANIDSSVGINTVPTVWEISGNGDYNGDGNADILWRNSSTGQNWLYLMTGATIDSSVGVNTVPIAWQIAGDGDYNGDGSADILWRNGTTGQNWMYLMTGATIDSSVIVNSVPTDWQIVNVD